MKKIVSLALLALLAVGVSLAQNKVVERSSNKMPVWVDKAEDGFIVVSSIGKSIEAAQNQCMDQVKTRIIESVAQNVKFSSQSTIEQSTSGSGIDAFSDKFSSSLQTQAANVPFIRGISISKAADSYWEKLQDKSTKAISYRYAIKYPFPSLELKKLVLEFEHQDKKMADKLVELSSAYANVASVEQIDRSIAALEPLRAYFFDDVRQNETKALQAAYRSLYDQILVQTVSEELGKANVVFLLNGRTIACAQRPQIKAQCAQQIKYSTATDNQYGVSYDFEQCIEGEGSDISLSYRVGTKNIVHKIFFTPKDQSFLVAAVGSVTLNKAATDSTQKLTIWIDIKSQNCGELNINSMTLNVGVIAQPLVIEQIDAHFEGDGTHKMKVEYTGGVEWVKSFLLNVAKGSLSGTYGASRTPFMVNFTLPYKLN